MYIKMYVFIIRFESLPSRRPAPCNPAAGTALHPLIWCSES